jgi:hypothetical protein
MLRACQTHACQSQIFNAASIKSRQYGPCANSSAQSLIDHCRHDNGGLAVLGDAAGNSNGGLDFNAIPEHDADLFGLEPAKEYLKKMHNVQ